MGLYESFLEYREKAAEVQANEELEVQRVEVLDAFRKQAEDYLHSQGIVDPTAQEVVKIAKILIDDAKLAEQEESKIAEAYEYGLIVSHGIWDGLNKLAAEVPTPEPPK